MPELRPVGEFEPSIAHNRRVPIGPEFSGPIAVLGRSEPRTAFKSRVIWTTGRAGPHGRRSWTLSGSWWPREARWRGDALLVPQRFRAPYGAVELLRELRQRLAFPGPPLGVGGPA